MSVLQPLDEKPRVYTTRVEAPIHDQDAIGSPSVPLFQSDQDLIPIMLGLDFN